MYENCNLSPKPLNSFLLRFPNNVSTKNFLNKLLQILAQSQQLQTSNSQSINPEKLNFYTPKHSKNTNVNPNASIDK